MYSQVAIPRCVSVFAWWVTVVKEGRGCGRVAITGARRSRLAGAPRLARMPHFKGDLKALDGALWSVTALLHLHLGGDAFQSESLSPGLGGACRHGGLWARCLDDSWLYGNGWSSPTLNPSRTHSNAHRAAPCLYACMYVGLRRSSGFSIRGASPRLCCQ